MIEPLISVGELNALQEGDSNALLVLDCSWHLPTSNRDATSEFGNACIDGARFFDIDAARPWFVQTPREIEDGLHICS